MSKLFFKLHVRCHLLVTRLKYDKQFQAQAVWCLIVSYFIKDRMDEVLRKIVEWVAKIGKIKYYHNLKQVFLPLKFNCQSIQIFKLLLNMTEKKWKPMNWLVGK